MANIKEYLGYIGTLFAGLGMSLLTETIGAGVLTIGVLLVIAGAVRWIHYNDR